MKSEVHRFARIFFFFFSPPPPPLSLSVLHTRRICCCFSACRCFLREARARPPFERATLSSSPPPLPLLSPLTPTVPQPRSPDNGIRLPDPSASEPLFTRHAAARADLDRGLRRRANRGRPCVQRKLPREHGGAAASLLPLCQAAAEALRAQALPRAATRSVASAAPHRVERGTHRSSLACRAEEAQAGVARGWSHNDDDDDDGVGAEQRHRHRQRQRQQVARRLALRDPSPHSKPEKVSFIFS